MRWGTPPAEPCQPGPIAGTTTPDRPHRPATTKRRGRMTDAKRATAARLGARLGFVDDGRALGDQLDEAFGRRAPRLLDVGCGAGEATVAWARDHPDHDVLAVELHPPSLVAALSAVDGAGLATVRVAEADVRDLLAGAGPGAVDHIRLLFPDPWPKRRHHHRRLVDAAFVTRAAEVLPVGGTFHLATDWAAYAEAVCDLLGAEPRFEVTSGPAPARPVTVYERLGREAGRTVTDLVAVRR